ncbi:conserved hypothetical protein [Histoplasma capsulatum var. duboisii H88]|uniref:Uncharacterized protein n=2 Tax=Ajellomyces capsulatus TaxID=5037 RepID=C0NV30_AJECG|nr:uncharacterized protein HCBG_06794 [Histoplasma capsulatum G186AR]EEH04843.1 conserved hypothetical protein [Histoplasma capsulatum G186AR]EGC40875.1 conserved hypothetical protein [Histoplasma capsulatum var. duboisii H88]
MSDPLNDARALRVTELMNDFRTIHINIVQLRTDPAPEEQFSEGYVVMNQCLADAQTLLNSSFDIAQIQGSSTESENAKANLQRVIVDASARRFQAHKIYLRMAAASRWVLRRNQILQGQKMSAQHVSGLRSASEALHTELVAITDSVVVNDLRSADVRAGYWLVDDPPLSTILNWIRSQHYSS